MIFSFLDMGFTADVFQRLAESLLHFIWQGSVLAAIVLLADWCLRGSARWRYAVHVAALLLMLTCVPVTYAVLEGQASNEKEVAVIVPENPAAVPPTAAASQGQEMSLDKASVIAADHPVDVSATPLTSPAVETGWEQLRRVAHFAAPYATVTYLLGVALMFSRLARALVGGHRLCSEAWPVAEENLLAMVARQARKIGLRTIPVVAWCGRTSVPLVAGLVKPMILLPVALANSLTPDQLEALLAHELAHLRRFDLLVNLLQRVAESFLFFHPAVWYVSRRISSERENCCDDFVLRAGWGRVEYADALVRMAEICGKLPGIGSANTVAILAAVGDNPSQFKRRILRLLGEQESLRLGVSRGMAIAILGGILAIILAIPVLFSAPSLVAQNEKQDSPQDTPAKNDPEPKNDREPEVLPGHYRVSLQNVPWKEVLGWYGRVMGDRIEATIAPEGNFSYESPRPLNHREISLLINRELLSRDYCLAAKEGGFSVQPAEVIARQYAEQLRKDFMHGFELRKGPDKFESYFELAECRNVGRTKPPAPAGPAIAYVLKARRDFSPQEATSFFAACFADSGFPSVTTGELILADGFAVLHGGEWLGRTAPALKKGEQIEVWQNYAQEWNSRPPRDYHLVVRGLIVGPDGKPVAGARVQNLLLEGAPDGPEGEKLRGFLNWAYGGEPIVDKDGKFQVSINTYTQFVRQAYFHISAPGLAPQRVGPIAIDSAKPAPELKIELKPEFSGRLRLVLPDGKPLDKGEVDITVQDDLWAWSQPMAKLSVGGDSIAVPNCPAGPLLLKVRMPGFVEQEIRDVMLVEDKVVEVKVAPKPTEAKPLEPKPNDDKPKEVFYFRGKEALERIQSVKPKWGESQHGIEFGLARLDDKRLLQSDERVRLEMFIRNTGKENVKVSLAADFHAIVPEVKDEHGEAVKVERIFLTGSIPLYRETLKPGEAFGFRHLGLGLGPRTWPPHWAEPKPGKYTLRHTHRIDVDPVDESKPGKSGTFTTGTIEFEFAASPEPEVPAAADPFAGPAAPAAKASLPIAPPAVAPEADPFAKPGVKAVPTDKPPENGVWRRFSPEDGRLEAEDEYKNGKLHGVSRRFDKVGRLVSEAEYRFGSREIARQFKQGKLVSETHYQQGKRNGATWERNDKYELSGQYLNDEQEGKWTLVAAGDWKLIRRYKEGQPDGVWEWLKGDQLVSRITFKEGKLIKEKDSPLPAYEKVKLAANEGKDPLATGTLKSLDLLADLEYSDTPFWEVLEDLHERFNCPMYFDPQAPGIQGFHELPVVTNEKQIPLHDCLGLLATEHGLTFDYRFHALWLTTPKALAAWKDSTGVSDLKPVAGSLLAEALSETPNFDFFASKPQDLPELMKKHYDLAVDVSKIPDGRWHPRNTPKWSLERKLPLRDALGITLTVFNCRCREADGKLIIEPIGVPPKEKAEPAREKPTAADHRAAPGTGLRINVPALGPAPLALDFAFPVKSKSTMQKQPFSFFFGVWR